MKTVLSLLFGITSLLEGISAKEAIYLTHVTSGAPNQLTSVTSGYGLHSCCDDGWIAYKKHCYHIGYGKRLKFSDAQDYCQHLSAYLVRVETLPENDFLKDLLKTTQAGNAWIGLTDQEHEGIWKWIDTDIPATFSDWGPGEPNNYQGQNEECVYFYSFKDYMWNDGMCHHKAVPLCEKD